jgi:hypothetical protein
VAAKPEVRLGHEGFAMIGCMSIIRRTRGEARGHGRAVTATPEPSPVRTASVDEVLDAIDALDLDAPWEVVADRLRPVLPRRRPMPPDTGSLPEKHYELGMRAGLGLDIGPAIMFVGDDQLGLWGVSSEEAFERAEANVRSRCLARRHIGLLHEPFAGVPTTIFQSRDGWASAVLLMPDLLLHVLGRRSGLLIAPMRDVLMLLPLDTHPRLPQLILDEFATADMNALALPVFTFVDGRLGLPAPVPPSRGREQNH